VLAQDVAVDVVRVVQCLGQQAAHVVVRRRVVDERALAVAMDTAITAPIGSTKRSRPAGAASARSSGRRHRLRGLRRVRIRAQARRSRPVGHVWVVAAAGLIGFAGNELVARFRIKAGREIGSAALIADGLHARTDGFTSLAVALGAFGVALGFPAADPIVGLGITVMILFVVRDAAKQVFGRLLDAVDPATVDLAAQTVREVPGVLDAGELRMRWIGHNLRAELALSVDATLTVARWVYWLGFRCGFAGA